MTQFPYDVFDQIKNAKMALNDIKNNTRLHNEEKIGKISSENSKMISKYNDMLNCTNSHHNISNIQKDLDALTQNKRDLIKQKTQYESQIETLKKQIVKLDGQTSSTNLPASLAILQSIAPAKFTKITETQLEGIISFVTVDSTLSFKFNRANESEIPPQFWSLLNKCYNNKKKAQLKIFENSWNDPNECCW